MTTRRPLVPLLLLTAIALAAVAAVVLPSSWLMPEVVHTEELIERSYRLDVWGRWTARVLLVAGLALFVMVWRRGGTFARMVGAVPLLLLAGAAWFSGERMAELLMFEQPETIRFVAHAEATHVADDELVMGLVVDGQARAYPVLMMAYYHIANDRLAGEPYVVTY